MLYIMSICDSPEILSVFKIIRITLLAIRIIVPILLLVSVMLEFAKAVTSQDANLIKKASMSSVRKAICMIAVFFIPTFVSIFVNLTSGDNYYEECLENSTTENIEAAFTNRANTYMSNVRENLTNSNYQMALSAVNKISDYDLKNQYLSELSKYKEALTAEQLINMAKLTKSESDYEKAASAVEALEDGEIKDKLNSELEAVAKSMKSYMAEYSSGGEYIENLLGIPRYDQCDTRWSSISYDTGGATFCSSSCGYTSFAMIAAGLNNDVSITPITVVTKLRNINVLAGEQTSRGKGAATTDELINYASSFGMSATSIGHDVASIQSALNSGKAVIALVPGHYVVLAPSGNANTAVLIDPFSNWADSRKVSGTYTLDYIFEVYGSPDWAAAYSN